MKFNELEEKNKWYEIQLGDKTTFSINGESKNRLLAVKTDLIELPNGEIVNKKFIKCITLDIDKTRAKLREKPELLADVSESLY